jgi:signal transduction histidine kinase
MWAGEIDGYHLEKRYLHQDGRVIWVELTASVIHDAAGPPYALAQIQDISDRRRLDLERATMLASEREYTRQLRDLTVMRADLTAMVAHELRSPIAALRIMASMLATGELSPTEEAETFRAVQTQITQLDRLVTDVASSAAAERDDFPVEFDVVSLAAVLADAEAFARTRLAEHPFTITEAPPVLVWCDPERVSQVLRNLLDNSAKHTPPGTRVELRVARDGGWVRFEVADDGPGIPLPELALILEKFGRCRRSVDHQTPGAGLGLYLSHRIIAALGGELTVSSESGHGTVFRFELMAVP